MDLKRQAASIQPCLMTALILAFFAVSPDWQGSGVGSVMLEQAEALAQRYLIEQREPIAANSEMIKMLVLKGHDKMLAYYLRRGYVCTGHTQPFSESGNAATDNDLYFIEIAEIINITKVIE